MGCVVYVLVTGGCLFGIRYPVWRLVLIMSLGIFGFEHFCFSYWLIVSSDRRCSFKSNLFRPNNSWNGSLLFRAYSLVLSSILLSGYVVVICDVEFSAWSLKYSIEVF